MKKTALALATTIAVSVPILTATPAQASREPIRPQIGTANSHYGVLGSGSYRVARDGRIDYTLSGMRGQRDVRMSVYRTTKEGNRLHVDWKIGEHRPVPAHPLTYRPNRDRQPAHRGMGAPVVKVTVERGWRGSWSATFALRLERDDRPVSRR